MRTTADQLSDVLDRWQSGSGPLYAQLADAIVSLAESGSLDHGTRLPSERALAVALHVSRNTVTAAYQRLRDDEWLEVRPGAAPTLGARARSLDGLGDDERFAMILRPNTVPTLNFTGASPAAAPVVRQALRDPEAFMDGPADVGNGYAALGDPELTAAIAEHLRARGIAATPDEIVITAGGQQAIWLAVTALAGPHGPVALEAVTYPGVFDAVAAAGSRPFALPMTPAGLDVPGAIALLRAVRPDAAYLTTFQNPTGTALKAEDAERLVATASALGTTIIDDRIMGDLALTGQPRRPLATYPGGESVITIGGLSKVFWGGLRIGWLHTNATLAAQLRNRKAAMDMGNPALFQRLAHRLLTEHYEATLAWRLDAMRESLAATEAAIAEHGLDWTFAVPAGGASLWVGIGDGSIKRFAARAADAGVPIAPASAFEVVPGSAGARFRLPFYMAPDDMRVGVKMLADIAP